MFKLFFVISLCSAIFMWYLHEYHTLKFIQIIKNIPYSSQIISHVHSFMTDTTPIGGTEGSKLFTAAELMEYNGENNSKGIYLAILGDVYNVKKGERHYGPGGPYHAFAGKDASRAFITGDFNEENLNDDVLDLSANELLGLHDWAKFYKNEYEFKGKLLGKYYDEFGKRTKYWKKLQDKINEAQQNKQTEKDEELLFPPCNVEWNADSGTKVWCSTKSGGIQRNWAGVPRKLYMVGSESYRCTCINLSELENTKSPQYARRGHLQLYKHCDPFQHACFVKE